MNWAPWTTDELHRLFDRYAAPLQLYAAQWTDEPADVVQEALIALVRQSRRPTSVGGWLFQVVRRKALNRARSARRRRRREQAVARQNTVWFEPSIDSQLDAAEVTAGLRDLPEEQREVIVARLWGQLTLTEIAQLVGTSVSTVYRRYETGLATLRERFHEPCAPIPQTHRSTHSPND